MKTLFVVFAIAACIAVGEVTSRGQTELKCGSDEECQTLIVDNYPEITKDSVGCYSISCGKDALCVFSPLKTCKAECNAETLGQCKDQPIEQCVFKNCAYELHGEFWEPTCEYDLQDEDACRNILMDEVPELKKAPDCYNYMCGDDGKCAYEPKDKCEASCDKDTIGECERSASEQCTYSSCVYALNGDLWEPTCVYDTIDEKVCKELLLKDVPELNAAPDCYSYMCGSDGQCGYEPKDKCDAKCDDDAIQQCKDNVQKCEVYSDCVFELDEHGFWTSSCVYINKTADECRQEIINTVQDITEHTADCYNFLCGDDGCTFEALKECTVRCDDDTIAACESSASGCRTYSDCKYKLDNGIWKSECLYKNKTADECKEDIIKNNPDISSNSADCYDFSCGDNGCEYHPHDKCDAQCDEKTVETCKNQASQQCESIGCEYELNGDLWEPKCVYNMLLEDDCKRILRKNVPELGKAPECYNYMCGDDGQCAYEPKDECDKVCDDTTVTTCQKGASECYTYSGCVFEMDQNGFWQPTCVYINKTDEYCREEFINKDAGITKHTADCYDFYCRKDECAFSPHKECKVDCDDETLETCNKQASEQCKFSTCEYELNGDHWEPKCVYKMQNEEDCKEFLLENVPELGKASECYNYMCGDDGKCAYEALDKCGEQCDRTTVANCQKDATACSVYKACVFQVDEKGFWLPTCVYTNKTADECREEIISNNPAITEQTAECYSFSCEEKGCAYNALDECNIECDAGTIEICEQNASSMECMDYAGCKYEKDEDGIWTPHCDYVPSQKYEELIEQENSCYEALCIDNEPVLQKRPDATYMEGYKSECFQYACNNASGRSATRKCRTYICMADKCANAAMLKATDDKSVVEISVDNDVTIDNYTMDEMKTDISESSEVDPDAIIVAMESDDDNNVHRIFVVADDSSAKAVVAAVEGCKSCRTTCNGIMRHVQSSRIISKQHNTLSTSSQLQSATMLVVASMLYFLFRLF